MSALAISYVWSCSLTWVHQEPPELGTQAWCSVTHLFHFTILSVSLLAWLVLCCASLSLTKASLQVSFLLDPRSPKRTGCVVPPWVSSHSLNLANNLSGDLRNLSPGAHHAFSIPGPDLMPILKPFWLILCHYLSISGLSAPVPRGRKGKKTKNQLLLPELKNADWLATCNPEVVLHDDGYKKHLKQHCNKWVSPSQFPKLASLKQPIFLTSHPIKVWRKERGLGV